MKKYHPALVALHWILAFMVIMGLIMGGRVLNSEVRGKKTEYR